MCEDCDAVDAVLSELLGRKPADLIMKRVTAKLHGAQIQNVLDCTVTT
jgi:hypothetical protein